MAVDYAPLLDELFNHSVTLEDGTHVDGWLPDHGPAALHEAKDATGHEHKGEGPGGGQFTKGSGGGGATKGGSKGKKDDKPAEKAQAGTKQDKPKTNNKVEGSVRAGSVVEPARTEPSPLSEKAARAKAAHHMVDKAIQRYAEEHNEPKFASAVKGQSYPNGEAF